MKVLLVGSHGFVGTHIREQLKAAGHDVLCSDTKIGLPVHYLMSANLDFTGAIVYAAAHPDIRDNWASLEATEAQWNDLRTFRTFLDIVAFSGWCGRFVYVSTSSVYPDGGDWDESQVPAPRSPYAASKLSCEAWLAAYAERWGWSYAITRLVACFGAGYSHGHVADMARMGRVGAVYGADNGQAEKHVVHVDDAAAAICLLATVGSPNGYKVHGVYNVSGGVNWNWIKTTALMGVPIDWSRTAANAAGWPGDVVGLTLNCRKLQRLGWEPTHDIAQGVLDALHTLGWRR